MHDAERAAKNQNARRLTSTVMIGVKLHGVRGSGHSSPDQADCEPTCSQLLPTTQQLCTVPIKLELQSDNDEDNPAHLNTCPGSPETKQHFKTEESEDLPFVKSVESLSQVSVKQEQDGGLSQPKGLPTPSPQHFGHQVNGVEAVDNRLGKIEKENADKLTISHTNVKEEMESHDDFKCDHVCQPVNTCDGNVENGTSAIITSMQSEENVDEVIDIGGRSSKMEESDEVTMTVETGEVYCQERGNWLSDVGEKEDADSSNVEICNDDLHDQNDASQANVQGLQELCEDSSFGVTTVNEDKEEDGGISEQKTRELSSKDKKSEKQPSNLCGDNILGRKSGNSTGSSPESSRGQHKKKARHQCQVCDYSTIKKSRLTAHMHVHTEERPYVCDICNKSFKLKQCLQVHKRRHIGDKQFQCEVCGYSSCQKSNLNVHMSKHSEEKPYVCEICNKSFQQRKYLKDHKTVHSDDKQFLCDNCGRVFSRKADMKVHMIMHTAERLFKCKTCGMELKYKSSLYIHEKTQHEKNAPVFSCNYCPYSSKCKGNTKAHEIHKHTQKISSQL